MEIGSIKALIASLLVWINVHGGLDVPETAPVVAFVPHAALEQMGCTGPCPILGFYPDDGVVYVDAKLALKTNVCARSIVLHELVHYVQDRTGRYAEHSTLLRWQLRELEAHEIQNQFLRAHGIRAGTSRNLAVGAFMGPTC